MKHKISGSKITLSQLSTSMLLGLSVAIVVLTLLFIPIIWLVYMSQAIGVIGKTVIIATFVLMLLASYLMIKGFMNFKKSSITINKKSNKVSLKTHDYKIEFHLGVITNIKFYTVKLNWRNYIQCAVLVVEHKELYTHICAFTERGLINKVRPIIDFLDVDIVYDKKTVYAHDLHRLNSA